MNEPELLDRIEKQAVEIASLKSQIESFRRRVADQDKQIAEMPKVIYRQMANGAVNCGASYGCSLARRCLGD